MKYSFEIKLKAVKAIKKGILIKEPYNKICRQWRDRVKHWEKIYDKHGKDGLKRQYRKHTYKEKLDVVKEVIKGNSINQVSINRNIPIKSIVKNNGDGPHYFFNKKDTKYAKIHIHQAKMK